MSPTINTFFRVGCTFPSHGNVRNSLRGSLQERCRGDCRDCFVSPLLEMQTHTRCSDSFFPERLPNTLQPCGAKLQTANVLSDVDLQPNRLTFQTEDVGEPLMQQIRHRAKPTAQIMFYADFCTKIVQLNERMMIQLTDPCDTRWLLVGSSVYKTLITAVKKKTKKSMSTSPGGFCTSLQS